MYKNIPSLVGRNIFFRVTSHLFVCNARLETEFLASKIINGRNFNVIAAKYLCTKT